MSFVKRCAHTYCLIVCDPPTQIYISQVVRRSSRLSVSRQVDVEEVSDGFSLFSVHFTGSDSRVCGSNTGEQLSQTTVTNILISFSKGVIPKRGT